MRSGNNRIPAGLGSLIQGAKMKIKAILFDLDGTLVDSNDLHAHAWVDAFAEYGLEIP